MKIKPTSFGYLFVAFLLLQLAPLCAIGQVLEHTYSHTTSQVRVDIINSVNGLKYVIIDSARTNAKVYNRQHVLERSVTFPAPPSWFLINSPYVAQVFCYFDALAPGEVVFILEYSYNGVAGRFRNMRLVDHNGTIRLDLPDSYGSIGADPGNPPILRCYKITHPYETRIYRLTGTMVNLPSRGSSTVDSRVFPNPASDLVNIEHGASLSGQERVLEVYNQRGQLVNKLVIPAGVQSTEIDTRSWAPGVYQYSVQGNEPTSGRFIVE